MRPEVDHKGDLRPIADALIAATNAFDFEAALALLAADAVIDHPSTGERFDGQTRVREYVERFFVGYRTVTRLLSSARTRLVLPSVARVRAGPLGKHLRQSWEVVGWIFSSLDAGHGPCCRHVRRNRASDALFARLSDFRTAA